MRWYEETKARVRVSVVCTVTPRQGRSSVAALYVQEGAMDWSMRLPIPGVSEPVYDQLLDEERACGMIKESAYTIQAYVE